MKETNEAVRLRLRNVGGLKEKRAEIPSAVRPSVPRSRTCSMCALHSLETLTFRREKEEAPFELLHKNDSGHSDSPESSARPIRQRRGTPRTNLNS